MNQTVIPNVKRIPFDERLRAAAPSKKGDETYGAGITRDATRLEPLHAIQVAFDQLIRHSEDRTRGEPWQFSGTWKDYVADTLSHAIRHCDVLKTAASAAEAMISDIKTQTERLQAAMSKKQTEDEKDVAQHPTLTTTGEPHPLEVGGYDANSDPNKPVEESDVAALKAGHASPAQAEAIQKSDAQHAKDKDPAESRSSDATDDEDEKSTPKKSAKK